MAGARHLEKSKKSPYLSNGLANLDEIWQVYVDLISKRIRKSKIVAAPI